jgi:anti-sigma regulatory factor (Ser/Thr protein kinase)
VDTQTDRLELTLHPNPQEAGRARDSVRHWLISNHFAASVDDGIQIASELVANASAETLKVNPDATITLHLFTVNNQPMLQVWDCSTNPPVNRAEDLSAERGRGVLISQALATDFGHEIFETGKFVWALLPTTPADQNPCRP